MNWTLTGVALRYRAVYLNISREEIDKHAKATVPGMAFVARLRENGFCVSEELLHAIYTVSADTLAGITECIYHVMGIDLNWAPLLKQWDVPTGESSVDHLITLMANLLGGEEAGIEGTTLRCGHFIPQGTFPLERYNGCPFCGTPFQTADFVYKGQGSKLKELRLFTEIEMKSTFSSLLSSATPLDATQKDSLQQLLTQYELPAETDIPMKETAMLVIDTLVENRRAQEASALLKTPMDILRYLWYKKTGHLQIIEPKTLIARTKRVYRHFRSPLDMVQEAAENKRKNLMLKYSRRTCHWVALWMNALPLSARQAAENMNPKRGMWVRMIRALRLGEYSRKPGMEHLAEILDVFYKQDYTTWQGRVDRARFENDGDKVLSLLKERPGLFARCLFATMLRFDYDKVLDAFDAVADKLPARLLLSLANTAESYFDADATRLARPITGTTYPLPPNKLLVLYDEETRMQMANKVKEIYLSSMERRFAALTTKSMTIYIDPKLYSIPVSVGDRATTIQDTSCALMGTRFPVEGDAVRLFMQWGKGLPAQHLDMDLSCRIALPDNQVVECAYYSLTTVGAKHSGDIRSIPDKVGTAEYIELSLPELEAAHARYVTFTVNAFSCGTLSPNLVVGWMNSAYPMTVSEETGVAYDPSCVQHMVRISEGNLSKGLVFGVLDVEKREIIWLEMPFTAQTIQGVDSTSIETLLNKLQSKKTIGELLELKSKAQHIKLVDTADEADESYTYEWALNPAEVSKLLLP